MIVALVAEAVEAGARLEKACETINIAARTIERWTREPDGEDQRRGPKTRPANALSEAEKRKVIGIATSPEFRDVSPKQIVPRLADQKVYVASESTFYRLLRLENMLAHRGKAQRPAAKAPTPYEATGPNQVWCWDITYLPSPVRGKFFYLYLIEDLWSRKIVGYSVERQENNIHAAKLFRRTCSELKLNSKGLVLHADNGGPMKGATMLATLQKLGVIPSFSRPHVSDDNPFPEALFRVLKYRPEYPSRPFRSLYTAQAWVERFVRWYNNEHRHGSIGFVTPEQRHRGLDVELLQNRARLYESAREQHPERWPGRTRNWDHKRKVVLNPFREKTLELKTKRPPRRASERAAQGATAPIKTVATLEASNRRGTDTTFGGT